MVPAMIVSLLGALWSASGAAGNLIKAVNRAYDEEETRGFLKVRGTAR
jgi:membrane protein